MTKYSGTVRSLVSRSESNNSLISNAYRTDSILNFRLEIKDKNDNVTEVRSVELRGESIRGNLHEGDFVELKGTENNGTIYAKEIYNFTTNALVKTKNKQNSRLALYITSLIVGLGLGGIIFFMMINSLSNFFR